MCRNCGKATKLTKVFLGVMITGSVVPKFVVWVHPVALVVEVLKAHHSVVKFSGTVFKKVLNCIGLTTADQKACCSHRGGKASMIPLHFLSLSWYVTTNDPN